MGYGGCVTDFPLRTRWIAPVGGLVSVAPIVSADEVVVRTPGAVSFHALTDGCERSRVVLPGTDLFPSFFLQNGHLLFTQYAVKRKGWVAAVTRSGVAWTAPLGGIVFEDAAAIVGDELWVVVDTRRLGKIVVARFDAATGDTRKAIPLRAGGDRVLLDGDARIVVSRVGDAETPSAYVLGNDGAPTCVLRRGALACGSAANGLLVTSTRGARDGSSTIEVCVLRDGRVLWSHAAASEVTCIARDEVVVIEAAGAARFVVLRDARTGDERGRVDVGPIEPAGATFVGSLLIVRHMDGAVLVDCSSLRLLGEAAVWKGALAGDLALVGGDGQLYAVPLPAA